MANFKIILFLHNGYMHMLWSMVNKTYKIIKHFKEEYKFYKNKAKDGIKLIYIYYQIKHIDITSSYSNNNSNNNKDNNITIIIRIWLQIIINNLNWCNKNYNKLAII
jgi:hypothetical protein